MQQNKHTTKSSLKKLAKGVHLCCTVCISHTLSGRAQRPSPKSPVHHRTGWKACLPYRFCSYIEWCGRCSSHHRAHPLCKDIRTVNIIRALAPSVTLTEDVDGTGKNPTTRRMMSSSRSARSSFIPSSSLLGALLQDVPSTHPRPTSPT